MATNKITEARAREVLKQIEGYLEKSNYEIKAIFGDAKEIDVIHIIQDKKSKEEIVATMIGYWKEKSKIRMDFSEHFVKTLSDANLKTLSSLAPFGVFRDCIWGTLDVDSEDEIKTLLKFFEDISK